MNEIQETKKQPPGIRETLQSDEFKVQVAKALPSGFSADKFIRSALTAIIQNPGIVKCNPASFFRCILELASIGLEADGRRAYLIPYKGVCTWIADYKGLVELALRNGNIAKIHADIVCENDTFEHNAGEIITHTYVLGEPRGAMIGVFVQTTTKEGVKQASIMTKEEVDAIRDLSPSGKSGPWVKFYNEQSKKTVFRRHSKWIKLSPEAQSALAMDTSDHEEKTPPTRRVVSAIEDPLIADGEEMREENGVS